MASKIPVSIRWALWLRPVPEGARPLVGCIVGWVVLLGTAAFFAALLATIGFVLLHGPWWALRWAAAGMSHRIMAVGALLLAGVGFFALKRRARLLYGWIEVVFAATGMWLGLDAAPASPAAALALVMGALYVLVRGIENVAEGRKAAEAEYSDRVMNAVPDIAREIERLARDVDDSGDG